jgi:hypothetical protein
MDNPFLQNLYASLAQGGLQEPQDYVSMGEPVAVPQRPQARRRPEVRDLASKAPNRAPMLAQLTPQGEESEMPSYPDYMREVLAEKRGSIEGIAKQLQNVRDEMHWSDRLDTAPLAAYLDSMTGSRLSPGFQGPTPFEEKQAMALNLENALIDQKDEYANQALQFFRNKAYMDQVSAQGQAQRDNQSYRDKMLALRKQQMAQKSAPQGKELTQNMIRTLNEGNQIPQMLDDVRVALDASANIMGPVEGRRRSLNPWDEQSQTLESQVRAASQSFGRYMEGGVLRKEDEAKYRRMFPNASDTPEVARNKLAIVERMLKQKQGSDMDAFRAQGYNLTGLDRGFEIPQMPGVIGGGMGPQVTEDALNNMTEEELEAFLNGQ